MNGGLEQLFHQFSGDGLVLKGSDRPSREQDGSHVIGRDSRVGKLLEVLAGHPAVMDCVFGTYGDAMAAYAALFRMRDFDFGIRARMQSQNVTWAYFNTSLTLGALRGVYRHHPVCLIP